MAVDYPQSEADGTKGSFLWGAFPSTLSWSSLKNTTLGMPTISLGRIATPSSSFGVLNIINYIYIYIGFPGIYNSRCIVLLSTTGGNLAIVSGFVAGWGRFVMEKLN